MTLPGRTGIGLMLIGGLLAACGGTAGSQAASSPSSTPSSSPAVSASASPSASVTPTIIAMNAGAMGMIVVAGASQMTVYTFSNDHPGVSNCAGACIAAWPALAVAAGQTPTAGPGVSGTLATITRGDGPVQVTYNGLPLYFFHNDHSPGDTHGNYTGWNLVRP